MKKLSLILLVLFSFSLLVEAFDVSGDGAPYGAPLGTESVGTYESTAPYNARSLFYVGSIVNAIGEDYRPSSTVYISVSRLGSSATAYSQSAETSGDGTLSHLIANSSSFTGGTYNLTVWNDSTSARQLLSECVFGVWGAAEATYYPGESIEITGGGLQPSSSAILTIVPEGAGSEGVAFNLAASSYGSFSTRWNTTAVTPVGRRDVRLFGIAFEDGAKLDEAGYFDIEAAPIRLDLNINGGKSLLSVRRSQKLNVTLSATYPNGTIIKSGNMRLRGQSISPSGPVTYTRFEEALSFDSSTNLWRKQVSVPVGFQLGDAGLYALADVGGETGSTASEPVIINVQPAVINILSLRSSSRRYFPGEVIMVNYSASYYPGGQSVSTGVGSVALTMPNGSAIRLSAQQAGSAFGVTYGVPMDPQIGAWAAYAVITDPFGNSVNATSLSFTVEHGQLFVFSEVSKLQVLPGDIVRIEASVVHVNGSSAAGSGTSVTVTVAGKVDSAALTLDSPASVYRGQIDTSGWEAGTYEIEIAAEAVGYSGVEMVVFNVGEPPFPLGTIAGVVIIAVSAAIVGVYYFRRRPEE